MRVTINTRAATADAARTSRAAQLLPVRAGQLLRKVSLDVEAEIKVAMPVLTGRARASWGHWSSGDLVADNPEASAADAIWQESATETVQGSNLEYVEGLNAGNSRKAPAGFIDLADVRGQDTLEQALAALMEQTVG